MITGIILTKNEEDNIKDSLKTLSFCNEVIVVDDNSTDKTEYIADKYGAKVIKRALDNDFAKQRNFALKKAKYDWVLFIDADERVSNKLASEIKKAITTDKYHGFYFKRQDFLWGKKIKHGEVGNIKLLRLGRKNKGKWKRKVHEKWDILRETDELKNPIIHYPHKDLSEFINHVDHFSTLHAEENIKEEKVSSILKIISMPFAHFINNYLFKRGFLDGLGGFIIAFVMSFHSFLSWSKMYLKQNVRIKNNYD